MSSSIAYLTLHIIPAELIFRPTYGYLTAIEFDNYKLRAISCKFTTNTIAVFSS